MCAAFVLTERAHERDKCGSVDLFKWAAIACGQLESYQISKRKRKDLKCCRFPMVGSSESEYEIDTLEGDFTPRGAEQQHTHAEIEKARERAPKVP